MFVSFKNLIFYQQKEIDIVLLQTHNTDYLLFT